MLNHAAARGLRLGNYVRNQETRDTSQFYDNSPCKYSGKTGTYLFIANERKIDLPRFFAWTINAILFNSVLPPYYFLK